MVKIFDYAGRVHYVAPSAIASISEASASSQWHGIRAYVKLFDGRTIESGDAADIINDELDRAMKEQK